MVLGKIYSMTGFGRGEAINDRYTLTVELKTVNNRYKDIRFKMGQVFNSCEMELKKKIESQFNRGSFDVFVNYKRSQTNQRVFDLDDKKIQDYIRMIQKTLSPLGVTPQISACDFLRADFYKEEDEDRNQELIDLLWQAFDVAMRELQTSRLEEGQKLGEVISEYLQQYRELYLKIPPLKDQYRMMVEERLNKKIKERLQDIPFDDNRYHQEIIYYLERYDIDEEIQRIDIHLSKFHEILREGGEAGRKIDFLLQELNRETNTTGSKSAHDSISQCIVDMKVKLEKIREQALNLE
jgi:uncharacterized protein (TIGR00255 family)